MPYSEVTISGYNSNPPSDDGTQNAANEVTWDKHKTKLGDPLKTAVETTQTNISSVVDAIEAELIPAGTKMLFQQTAAPTGWTKETTHNDKSLRVVTGAASSGGSTAFSSIFAARTIAQANLPNVSLSSGSLSGSVSTSLTNGSPIVSGTAANFFTAAAGSDRTNVPSGCSGVTVSLANGNVSFGGSVPLGGSGTAMDFDVQYVDTIIAAKD